MIRPSTLTFLRQLKKNNNKPWFDMHKDQYLAAKGDLESLVQQILETYSKTDISLSGLQVKDCVFRIYKDVRFSKDKTPYKTNLAASFNKGGKRVHLPGYYFHIEPGNKTICGGGIWMPGSDELKKIRQEIDYNFEEFQSILKEKNFKRLFGKMEDENALVRPPQGYTVDNPAIEFLKMRNFIVGRSFEDKELTSDKLLKELVKTFSTMKPLIDFLTRALEE